MQVCLYLQKSGRLIEWRVLLSPFTAVNSFSSFLDLDLDLDEDLDVDLFFFFRIFAVIKAHSCQGWAFFLPITNQHILPSNIRQNILA
jgi:hypothetical protein